MLQKNEVISYRRTPEYLSNPFYGNEETKRTRLDILQRKKRKTEESQYNYDQLPPAFKNATSEQTYCITQQNAQMVLLQASETDRQIYDKLSIKKSHLKSRLSQSKYGVICSFQEQELIQNMQLPKYKKSRNAILNSYSLEQKGQLNQMRENLINLNSSRHQLLLINSHKGNHIKQYNQIYNISKIQINNQIQTLPQNDSFSQPIKPKRKTKEPNKKMIFPHAIEKSLSVQYPTTQEIKEANSLAFSIKKILNPHLKFSSMSVPVKLQNKIDQFLNTPSKRFPFCPSNKNHSNKRSNAMIIALPHSGYFNSKHNQKSQSYIEGSYSKPNMSGMFKKLRQMRSKGKIKNHNQSEIRYQNILLVNSKEEKNIQHQFSNKFAHQKYKMIKNNLKLKQIFTRNRISLLQQSITLLSQKSSNFKINDSFSFLSPHKNQQCRDSQ